MSTDEVGEVMRSLG
ncbi:hypothetical protein [Nostoc sp. ATCC 53789]|nr:hypothetical protein [Nostoc sp. ATCC 53789]